jgi:hypothetical protein
MRGFEPLSLTAIALGRYVDNKDLGQVKREA